MESCKICDNLYSSFCDRCCCYLWANTKELVREAKETSDPAIAWIGIGMNGEGNFYAGLDYIKQVHLLSTKEEKAVYVKQFLYENRSQLWNLEHIVAKIRCNYACGYFGAKEFVYYAESGFENHFMWELCAPWGKYYWRTSQYTFGFIFGMYIIYLLGGIISFIRIIKGQKIDHLLLTVDISFVGYFLVLMIWEANNRQLYNFIPLFFVGMVLHTEQLIEMLKNVANKLFSKGSA